MNAFPFRNTAFAYFQVMSIMCNLAKQAVIDARTLFLDAAVVTAQMLDADLFDWRNQIALPEFQSKSSVDTRSLANTTALR